MRVSESDDLSAVGGVGENFLVASHGGVKYHLTRTNTLCSDGSAAKNCAVSESKDSMRALCHGELLEY